MNDKLVTHEDRQPIADLRHWIAAQPDHPWTDARRAHLLSTLDRLIAAAEADQPPLPEGWVVYRNGDGSHRVLWHTRGGLFVHDDCSVPFSGADAARDRLTPLRPTATEGVAVKRPDSIREQWWTYRELTKLSRDLVDDKAGSSGLSNAASIVYAVAEAIRDAEVQP